MAESTGLENRHTLTAYLGFKSLSPRQSLIHHYPPRVRVEVHFNFLTVFAIAPVFFLTKFFAFEAIVQRLSSLLKSSLK